MADDLAFSDASTLAAKIKAREISSLELLDHYLARIEKYNPDINAVVCLTVDKARQRAREADEALARGEDWGVLHGLPMTVKESYNMAGLPTTWGNPELKDNIADRATLSLASVCRTKGPLFLARPMCPFTSLIFKVTTMCTVQQTTLMIWNEHRAGQVAGRRLRLRPD